MKEETLQLIPQKYKELSEITTNNYMSRNLALAGEAQWIGHWPVNQRVAGLIPSQGTCLGCRLSPQ